MEQNALRLGEGSTVHVVDATQYAQTIRDLLASQGTHSVTYGSAAEFLSVYRDDAPGCLLVDAHPPGMDGLELQLLLGERQIHIPVIFLSSRADVELAVTAMKRGASDFLLKPFDQQALLEAVNAGLARDAQDRSRREVQEKAVSRLRPLTARERDVLALLLEGKSNKIIAADLQLSPKTVEFHRSRIMMKTRADSLAELIQMSVVAGITAPPKPAHLPPASLARVCAMSA